MEFASHQGACTAYNELQGTQLHGKNICLQWFDHKMTTASPIRLPGQHLDGNSPMTDSSKYAGRNSFQPTTPGLSAAALTAQSPFSMLASSPHSPFAHSGAAVAAAAAAAAHQQQMAALFAGHRPQQKMHRQASAPLSSALNPHMAASPHVPPPPPLTIPGIGGGYNGLHSPGPMHAWEYQGCEQDATSVAAATAAAAINLSAAMAAASMPLQAAQDLTALQQLATMQQQQLAALAVQQLAANSQQMDAQQASPLSPARSLQQQQQQGFAIAALHSQQQQLQAELLQQQQQEVGSPAPAHSQTTLQMARSMPAGLGASLGSSGSQSQSHSGSLLLQKQQRQLEALAATASGSAGPVQASPFALSQPDPHAAGDAASDSSGSASDLADASNEANTGASRVTDIAPASARSLRTSKASYHAKKQLFGEDGADGSWEHGLSLLPSIAGSWPPPVTSGSAGVCPNGVDDTASSAPGVDVLTAAALAAGSGAFAASGWGSAQTRLSLDAATPELLAALQSYPSEPLPYSSELMHASNEQIAAATAAAAVALEQQQQLLAAALAAQQCQLPPMSRPQQRFSDIGGIASSNDLAARLSSMSIKDARASDSQVLLGGYEQRGSMRRSSPMLPSNGASPAQQAAPGVSSGAQAWQRGVAAITGQQLQLSNSPGPVSAGVPAAEAFRSKHKQQLQLALPEFEFIRAPMTCTAVPGGWEHTLIGTDVVPESPAAAALRSQVDYQAAMLAAAGGAASSTAMPAMGSSWGNTDWSAGSALSALLSPAHVSTLAGRRWTDVGAPPAAASSGFSNAAASWGSNLSRDRSLSCGLGTVSEELAVTTASEWGVGSQPMMGGVTRHSSLCLDGQQLSGGDGAGLLSEAARELLTSSARTNPGSKSGEPSIPTISKLKRAGLSEHGAGLYSSGSFTFSPHLLQHKQSGSSTDSGAAADDATITEPFQMPAFFRPSASNQEVAQSPVTNAPGATVAAAAGSAPLTSPVRRSVTSNVVVEEADKAPLQAQQLQHSHSMPAGFGPLAAADFRCAQEQPQQQQQQGEEPPGYGCVFRSIWGSGAGDPQ